MTDTELSGASAAALSATPSSGVGPPVAAMPAPSAAASATDAQTVRTQLYETVKWMIGACAAIAAIIAGTVQFKGLGDLGFWQVVAGGACAVCALVLVILAIARAGAVLTTPRLSAAELTDIEVTSLGVSDAPFVGAIKNPLVREIREQKSYLLDGFESIEEYYDQYLELRDKRRLVEGAVLERSTPPSSELPELLSRIAAQEVRAADGVKRLEDTAQLLEAQARFKRLTFWLLPGGILFIVAVIMFGVIVTGQAASPRVTSPIRANVYVLDPRAMGLSSTCVAKMLTGAIIGGRLAEPDVVVDAIPGCPGAKFAGGKGYVAVPIAPIARQ